MSENLVNRKIDNLKVKDDLEVKDKLTIGGNCSVKSNCTVDGLTTCSDKLVVSGGINGGPDTNSIKGTFGLPSLGLLPVWVDNTIRPMNYTSAYYLSKVLKEGAEATDTFTAAQSLDLVNASNAATGDATLTPSAKVFNILEDKVIRLKFTDASDLTTSASSAISAGKFGLVVLKESTIKTTKHITFKVHANNAMVTSTAMILVHDVATGKVTTVAAKASDGGVDIKLLAGNADATIDAGSFVLLEGVSGNKTNVTCVISVKAGAVTVSSP